MSKISTAKMQTNFKKLRENWPLNKTTDTKFLIKHCSQTKITDLQNEIDILKFQVELKDALINAKDVIIKQLKEELEYANKQK